MREAVLVRGDQHLWTCQVGATLAVLAHFTAHADPAVVSMPTGSGKTEVMMALAFAMQATRVLVVTPSVVLRDQTKDRFLKLAILRQAGFLDRSVRAPRVHELKTRCAAKSDWNALTKYEVVVATPKTISPAELGVAPPPNSNLFDVIFIDEAHHAPAETWRAIVDAFNGAKHVLLTATPFRRDRKRMPGRLVYHYPLGRALDDGIYRPISFHSVRQPINAVDDDRLLAAKTAEVLRTERTQNPTAAALIRVDRDRRQLDLPVNDNYSCRSRPG